MTSGKLKKILMGLRENGEEKGKIEALTQLCNVVCTDHVESLSTFHVDSFIPLLIGLLNQDKNPEVMLLAARALTYMCDVLPSSCFDVVQYEVVPAFYSRLLTIEFMDLVEQVINDVFIFV